VNLGYQWNGSSVLAGDISLPDTDPNQKKSLPDQFFWTVGADVGIKSRVTVALDILGQRTMDAPRLISTNVTTFAGQLQPATTFQEIAQDTGSFNIVNGAAGVKVSLGHNLLATANMIVELNDGGLRDKVSPLFGLSYTH
jgi:hypothetical protein